MKFPQYRKYKNGRSYFKINSLSQFDEFKLLGNKLEKYSVEVKILPDRNYLHDLLFNYEDHWEIVEEKEFESFVKS